MVASRFAGLQGRAWVQPDKVSTQIMAYLEPSLSESDQYNQFVNAFLAENSNGWPQTPPEVALAIV